MASASLPGFGPLLKQFRRAAHLTQAQLAERAGFSVTYMSKLERGVRQPLPSTIALLADALNLSGDERVAFESAAQTAQRRIAPARQRAADRRISRSGDSWERYRPVHWSDASANLP